MSNRLHLPPTETLLKWEAYIKGINYQYKNLVTKKNFKRKEYLYKIEGNEMMPSVPKY